MKLNDDHFEDYLNKFDEYSLHPKLAATYNALPSSPSNLILYGPCGIGKYTQSLAIIRRYSASKLKYEKKISIPFNKNIYLQEIIRAGETLRGEDIIGSVSRPDITTLDCLLDAEFNLGYALGAIVANRSGATIAANTMFYKSCLFATRALILFKNKTLPLTYDDILLESASLNLGAYATLVTHAFNVRKGDYLHNASLFENITYINQFIIPTLKTALDTSGDTVLVS